MNAKLKSAWVYLRKEWIEPLIVAGIIAFLVSTFLFQLFKIPTGSMQPTLMIGDRIVVNKFIYGAKLPWIYKNLPALQQPKRGDIMVFIFPLEPRKDYIKRVIALPGETVSIKDGMVYINGAPLTMAPFKNTYYYNKGDFSDTDFTLTVPENCYFVLGDNSMSSYDSRYWGCVQRKYVLGKAIAVFWPLNRIRQVK